MAQQKPKRLTSDQLLTKGVEMPAVALDRTVQVSNQILHAVPTGGSYKKAKDYWHMLGPGLTTGASDDDPSGIATYSQAGAQFGFGFLWLSIWTFPLMSVVQEMCARIGLVTGRGLAGNIRNRYWVAMSQRRWYGASESILETIFLVFC